MNIGNITSDNFNLDSNGKDIQIEVYEQLIEQLQQENEKLKIQISAREEEYKKLEDNWNKLKAYLNDKSERAVGEDEYVYDEIYNEMQEIEQGSDSK